MEASETSSMDPQSVKKDPAIPSPVTPGSSNNNNNGSASRRPPRKSTLTQQQKNQKRQRATQDQLMTLEVEFNKNPTPTAVVRERIAQEINMTERSVQIWFQNRRAKIKNIARKSIENGEDCESIPESMRRHLAMQALESGKGFFPNLLGPGAPFLPYGSGPMSLNTDASAGKVVIQHFNCRSLSIGSWRRVGQSQMDLIIFYSPEKACVTYYINNDSAGYKIEYPFATIKNINLLQGDITSAAEGASQRLGALVVELTQPPKFYMDSSGSGGFYECGDFTEDQQASQVLVHHLGGPSKVLSGQLAKLVSLDAFQNRHMLNVNPLAVSAPVSPIGHRPASQPNHMLHPHSQMSLFPEQPVGLMGPPGPRGHKRQRSRSVPVAIDFSMLRRPMPSFLVQEPAVPAPPMQDPAIFAPIPQHHHNSGFAPGPIGPNLSIDTSAAYGMDFRQFAGSMSATTLNSPSEFGTPAFFTSGPGANDAIPQTTFNTPYSNPFLSVDPSAMIGTSNTPLSMISHGDPVIADQSPPLTGLHRSQSADMFGTPGDHNNEDAFSLNDIYSKQMSMAFRSPLNDANAFDFSSSAIAEEPFEFNSPPPSDHKFNLPFRNPQQSNMNFQSPTPVGHHHQQQQLHQDSGIAFQSPGQMYQSPKDHNAMLYQDAKMFQSPAQMQHHQQGQEQQYHSPAQPQHDPSLYQTPPMHQDELDQNQWVQFGTIDPASL